MNVRTNKAQVGARRARQVALMGAVLLLTQLALPVHAGPYEQAKRIYERLAGEPPPPAVLQQMAAVISNACPTGCAPGNPALLTAAMKIGRAHV